MIENPPVGYVGEGYGYPQWSSGKRVALIEACNAVVKAVDPDQETFALQVVFDLITER